MNFNNLTEKQFNRMAEELCSAWNTLAWLSSETNGDGQRLVSHRKQMIAEALGQDPNKAPKWPPARKWQVGLTQYRTMEFQATVEVEAASRDEAKKKAFEVARKDAERLGPLICWTEGHESHDHERELDEDVWCCDEIND